EHDGRRGSGRGPPLRARVRRPRPLCRRRARPRAARPRARARVAVGRDAGDPPRMRRAVTVESLQAFADRPRVRAVVLAVALGFFAVEGIVAARTNTPTVDEFVYLPAGYYYLRTSDLRFEFTNPPLLKMVAALPLLAMNIDLDLDPRWRDDRGGWGAWIFATRF